MGGQRGKGHRPSANRPPPVSDVNGSTHATILDAAEQVFAGPHHPYTEALLSAVPKPDPRTRAARIILEREVPDPANAPPGCHFHPRCRYAEARCKTEVPALTEVEPGRWVSCHRARELSLRGVV